VPANEIQAKKEPKKTLKRLGSSGSLLYAVVANRKKYVILGVLTWFASNKV